MYTTETIEARATLHARQGLWSWLFTHDNRRVAILYLVAITCFFFAGSAATGFLRTEALRPQGEVLLAEDFDRLFTLHGLLGVFFFLLPALMSVLGNFLVPRLVGLNNVAFPRLNLLTWYLFVAGGLFLGWSIIHGAVDAGWTLAMPYSTRYSSADLVPTILGLLLAGVASGLMGLNLVVTVHRRPKGRLSWFDLPVFVWGQYINALALVLLTPLLVAALVLLLRDELGLPPLTQELGRDALLYRRLFWAYMHPAMHAPLLAGVGITSRLLTTFAGRPLHARRTIIAAVMSIALLGTFSAGHLVLPGQSNLYTEVIAPLFGLLVAVPCAVIILHWLATLYRGSVRCTSPMLYAYAFAGLFTVGGASGLFLAATPLGAHLQGTTFEVAHLHYFVVGGVITAFLGGLHYWWPSITGRLYPENLARGVVAVVFLGFNTMFLPQLLLGLQGKPSRTHEYDPSFQVLEVLSSAGATILVAGLILPALYLGWSFFWGPPAPPDPWAPRKPVPRSGS